MFWPQQEVTDETKKESDKSADKSGKKMSGKGKEKEEMGSASESDYTEDEQKDKKPILMIFYGSHTGTAKAYARMLGTYAVSHGFEPIVCSMNEALPLLKEGKESRAMLFVVSTWGFGAFPSNAQQFNKEIKGDAKELKDLLNNIPYAILGLGNSHSDFYNQAAKDLDAGMKKIGAKSFLPTQLSCDLQPNGHDDVFRAWKNSIWEALGCSTVSSLSSVYSVKASSKSLKCPPGFVLAAVKQNTQLTPEGYLPRSRLITISIPLETQKEMLGGCTATSREYLEIMPYQSPDVIDRALKRLGMEAHDTYTIKPLAGASASYFDDVILSGYDILRELIDLNTVPTRSFLEALTLVASNADDKDKLQDLANDLGEGSEFERLTKGGAFSILDILEMFPSLDITLSQLLTYAPHNKQRTFSIANFVNKENPTTEFEVCYTIPTHSKGDRTFEGLCSGMLNRTKPNDKILVRLVNGNATIPKISSPCVLIALGTGISPIRAILQERSIAHARGEKVGPSKLFYGFRNAGKNDLFRAEMEKFEAEGHCSCTFVASNDQKEFRTPMMEMDASLSKFLGSEGEIMYCGPGGNIPHIAEAAMLRCDIDISDFRVGGRYHHEFFTPDFDQENLLKASSASKKEGTLADRIGEAEMFCFQCQQTKGNVGCTEIGVCGKTPDVAALQDLVLHALKTLGFYLHEMRSMGCPEVPKLNHLTLYSLFTTVTNVNFDSDRFLSLLQELKVTSVKTRIAYEKACKANNVPVVKKELISIPASPEDGFPDIESLVGEGKGVGVLTRFVNPETQNAACVAEMLTYGLKGLAAYADHSLMNGIESTEIYEFMHRCLHFMSGKDFYDLGKGLAMCLEAGKINVATMAQLYNSNKTLGVPTITKVPVSPTPGKCILVSGHDLIILKGLLELTEPLGINVYTHGEMLPAHSYPDLHKFKTLAGHFGGAWMRQAIDFPHFPGPVLMTTNCLTEPQEDYACRLFTAGAVGWKNIPHIGDNMKDIKFDAVIACAQSTKGRSGGRTSPTSETT
jgi:hydroxylamine reductase